MHGDRTGPSTILCLHAHPDDEAMLTGAFLAKASSVGLRTIVVYGTRGEAGETEADLGTETLGQRREREAVAACGELGVQRIEFLDHVDSGMAGTATNHQHNAFSNAEPAEVAARLHRLVAGEELLAIVGYDDNGTYGHPDHLQVNRVANALAELIAPPWLLDATYNREYLATLPDSDGSIDPGFAAGEADLTHFVQGEDWFRAKIDALKHHDSQARRGKARGRRRRSIDGWRSRHGTEWFIARSPTGADDLGPLGLVVEPKEVWSGPLSRPNG